MIFLFFLNSFVLIVRLPKQFLAKVLQSLKYSFFSGSTALIQFLQDFQSY
jgi:hypothetical protein